MKDRLDDVSRRDFLMLSGAGAVSVGSYKAIDNVLLGYGTNLKNQHFSSLAAEDMGVSSYSAEVDGTDISVEGLYVDVGGDERLFYPTASRDEAARLDSRYGLDGVVEEIVVDAQRIDDGDYSFELHTFEEFFERLASAETRPFTTGLLRGFEGVKADEVREFTGVSPEDPEALLRGLRSAFTRKTSYDVPRYIAGSITDNIFFKKIRLRPYFNGDVDYDALNSDAATRLFCYEYVYRSIESLHAAPAHQQEVPVVGFGVHDSRHKHYYTGVASVLEEDDELVVPVTFVDYTRTTLYDDFGLTEVLGKDLNAYNSGHRATRVDWE